jgi:uncharacterized membrane protein YeaQ/YmgE (transglycosylase-associated protein family)
MIERYSHDSVDTAGLVLGLIVSKIVSITGEGTVVNILLGIVGAVRRSSRLSLRRWRN